MIGLTSLIFASDKLRKRCFIFLALCPGKLSLKLKPYYPLNYRIENFVLQHIFMLLIGSVKLHSFKVAGIFTIEGRPHPVDWTI